MIQMPRPSRDLSSDPRVHSCARCNKPNAPCGMAGQWWCVKCAPAEYWSKGRAA